MMKFGYIGATIHIFAYKNNSIGKWRPFSLGPTVSIRRARAELIRLNIINITVADTLAPRVARTSTSMILTM